MAFPLLNLPYSARLHVLSLTDDPELLAISMLSKRMHSMVMRSSASSRHRRIWVTVAEYVQILIRCSRRPSVFIRFYEGHDPKPTEFHVPTTVSIENTPSFKPNAIRGWNRRRKRQWTNMTLPLGKWLERVVAVFHTKEIEVMRITNLHSFTAASFHSAFRGINIGELNFVSHDGSFLPATTQLTPTSFRFNRRNPFRSSHEFQSLIAQNSNLVEICYFPRLNIDDLLVCNAKRFTQSFWTFSDADALVRWFKLWEKGVNPRLEHLSISLVAQRADIDRFVARVSKFPELPSEVSVGYAQGNTVSKGFELRRENCSGKAHVVMTERVYEDHGFECEITVTVINY